MSPLQRRMRSWLTRRRRARVTYPAALASENCKCWRDPPRFSNGFNWKKNVRTLSFAKIASKRLGMVCTTYRYARHGSSIKNSRRTFNKSKTWAMAPKVTQAHKTSNRCPRKLKKEHFSEWRYSIWTEREARVNYFFLIVEKHHLFLNG